ncbi:MAG: chalcone and stilbene synthase domain protein [Bacteroidetes bacterium]|jgi:predicted naringenin-chalcone synthase|nr:chalcone and stilbene synthase domain protein [Bacteroidota bacterium]
MHAAYSNETASRKLNMLFSNSGIEERYSVLPDFDKSRNEHVFFNGTPSKANVENRISVFKQRAIPLAIEAINDSCRKLNTSIEDYGVTHLITVTCTGLSAPGIDAEIIEQLKLPNDIYRTSVNFLGCNAAFHALKIADMICKTSSDARVLIVCVELCTLHFQPKHDNDNLLSNTIFGDGAAAVLLSSSDLFKENKGLSIEGFYSVLLNKGKDLMGWNISPVNFEMILDAGIPDFIGSEIKVIVDKAVRKYELTREDIDHWAIHPGGKKIVDTIKKQLSLSEEASQPSYEVLNKYGNMSSPTILFVLNELIEEKCIDGENIFSMGFGPGLSVETALFRYA